MPRLENRSIIVTGGASGIGRALCVAFAAEGARVVVGDVVREPLHVGGMTTDQLIAEAGGVARFVEADVRSGDDIDRLVAAALELGDGRLDVIVNNAMVAGKHSKGLLETSEDDWDIILDVGLRGLFLCCQRAVRQMLTQEPRGEVRGRVINISSQHGMVGAPGNVAYSAMKGGVVNLTRQIAVDFAKQGIVCNAIAPGKIVVPREGGQDADLLSYAHARTPWPRLGDPEDVAALGVFLASDECRFMTGANVLHRRRVHGLLGRARACGWLVVMARPASSSKTGRWPSPLVRMWWSCRSLWWRGQSRTEVRPAASAADLDCDEVVRLELR